MERRRRPRLPRLLAAGVGAGRAARDLSRHRRARSRGCMRSARTRSGWATTAVPATTSSARSPAGRRQCAKLAGANRSRSSTGCRAWLPGTSAAGRRAGRHRARRLPARQSACSTRRGPRCRPFSTGSCRRSAIRSPTSASAPCPGIRAPDEYGGILGLDAHALGIPTEAEFLAHYYEHAVPTAPLLRFHLAFALFRFAVIFVGIADRVRAGSAAGTNAAALAPLAQRFARRALESMEGQGVILGRSEA